MRVDSHRFQIGMDFSYLRNAFLYGNWMNDRNWSDLGLKAGSIIQISYSKNTTIKLFLINIQMSLFSKVQLKELKQTDQKILRIAVSNASVNPTIAIATPNKIHMFNESGERLNYELSRNITPTCIQWHPTSSILAIGWDIGKITLWSEDTKTPKQESKPHTDAVILIRFNASGSRMITSDMIGKVAIWRGINLLACYQKDWAITHCLFCDLQLPGMKNNLGNMFIFAGRSGTVCLANDMNMCSDVCRVGGTIKALIFYQKESSAIVITSSLLLVQFKINFTQKIAPEKKIKLSISGEPENLSSIWIGACLLATCSNENMIRFWQLEADENYALTVFDILPSQLQGANFTTDKISLVAYDTKNRSLVAGTRQGKLLFWKNMALGNDSPVDKQQWAPQPFLTLSKAIQILTVGKNNGVIVCKQMDNQVVIISETKISARLSDPYRVLLSSSDNLEIFYDNGQERKKTTFNSQTSIKGIDARDDLVLYWTNKKLDLLRIRNDAQLNVQTLGSVSQKVVLAAIINSDLVLVGTDYGFNIVNLTGQVKQSISFQETEGKLSNIQINNNYLVAWTYSSYFRVFVISPKDCKPVISSRKFQDSRGLLGQIRSCSINSDGTKIGIIYNNLVNGVSSASNKFVIFDSESDSFQNCQLEDSKIPVSFFWDRKDKRFFGVQVQYMKTGNQIKYKQQFQNSEQEENSKSQQSQEEKKESSKSIARDFITYFYTAATGIKQQDRYQLSPTILNVFDLKIPYIYLIDRKDKDKSSIKRIVLHDFHRIDHDDQLIKTSILNFSFHLTAGNLDQAYKSVKSIQKPAIWEKIAAMAVKSRRLDVAQICIGNMRFARGARSIRQAKKQPQIQTQLAMVAIQLDLPDEARSLYEDAKRYDLINKTYQAGGEPDKSIEIAQKHDRINMKNTLYNSAKYYQAANDFEKAIQYFEKSGTHFKQVPKMLFQADKLSDLQEYVQKLKQPQLYLWLGQYKQSIGELNEAIKLYQQAKSSSNLVRLYLSQNQTDKAIRVCNSQSEPQACFLLARFMEKQNKVNQAIHFYAKAQYYSQAVKLAMDRGMDGQVMSLSVSSPKQVAFRSAVYFEKKKSMQQAVLLYRQAGAIKKSNVLAKKYNLVVDERQQQAEEEDFQKEGTNNVNVSQRVNQLADSGKHEKALGLLLSSKQYDKALQFCTQNNVPITQQLVKKILDQASVKSVDQSKKTELMRTLADKCRKTGSFQQASQLYTQLGDRAKAMKSLIELGDQQKVITFATNARTPQIYILAGNFLQTADWHKNGQLVKTIINFYNRAKAFDSLAGFFEACSSLNYDKAIMALKQALKHAQKSSSQDKNNRVQNLQEKIRLTEKYLNAQNLAETDVDLMLKELYSLLQTPNVEQAVRIGDIYAILIQYNYEMQDYNACYQFLKKMQQRKIVAVHYVDQQIIKKVYASVGVQNKRAARRAQQEDIIEQDIRY